MNECSQCSHEYRGCLPLRFLLNKLYEKFRQPAFFFLAYNITKNALWPRDFASDVKQFKAN